MRPIVPLILAPLLAACGNGETGGSAELPGDIDDTAPFDAIASGETVHFSGTEPFWGGEVSNGELTWSTPDNIDGM